MLSFALYLRGWAGRLHFIPGANDFGIGANPELFQDGTGEVLQTITIGTVTIIENFPSTLTTGAVYLSSQVSPASGQETVVLITTMSPTTYITAFVVVTKMLGCSGVPISCGYFPRNDSTSSVVTQSLNTLTAIAVSEILYAEVTASPLYTTSNIAPGIIWASGIQIRWTGNYPPNQSHSLTPGQKAGISLGIIISIAIISVIALWRIRLYRFKSKPFDAAQNPIGEAVVEETQIRELPGTSLIRTASESAILYPPNMVAAPPLESSNELLDSRRQRNLGGLARPPMTPTMDSSMAEIGSVTSIKRKPVQPLPTEALAQMGTEQQSDFQEPYVELDTTSIPTSSSKDIHQPTVSVSVSKVQPSLTEEQRQQAYTVLSSTSEGSTSSGRDTTSDVGDEEGIRVELARVMERKQQVKEMQRLKEEEEILERREEELLGRLKTRGGNVDGK
jgi:hypothetical protein